MKNTPEGQIQAVTSKRGSRWMRGGFQSHPAYKASLGRRASPGRAINDISVEQIEADKQDQQAPDNRRYHSHCVPPLPAFSICWRFSGETRRFPPRFPVPLSALALNPSTGECVPCDPVTGKPIIPINIGKG